MDDTNFDIMDYCKKNKEGVYEIVPSVMFPAVIIRIREVRAGADAAEMKEPTFFMRKYEHIKDEALDLALHPVSMFEGDDSVSKMLRALRAEALSFAEDYFSRVIAHRGDEKVLIHITRDEAYKR